MLNADSSYARLQSEAAQECLMRTRAMLACRAKRRKNARKLGLLSGKEQGARVGNIQGKRLTALTPLTSLTSLTPKS